MNVFAPRERALGSTSSQRRTKRLFTGVCRPRLIVLTAGFALNKSTFTATGLPLTEIVATPKSKLVVRFSTSVLAENCSVKVNSTKSPAFLAGMKKCSSPLH